MITLDERISIGISAYGNLEVTKTCLESLFMSCNGNFELILVDDCSPDKGEIKNLFLSVKGRHENTVVYSFTENLEYSGSLNCILSHAKGKYIFFVSNDIYVTPEYLKALIAVADSHPDCGIARGISNFVDNMKPEHSVDLSGSINSLRDVHAIASKIYELNKDAAFEDEYLTGDAFLVKRELIDKIGTLDPLFYGYFADHDFGIRVHRAGYKLLVAKGAFAFHNQAANFEYLDEENRMKKLNARWSKVYENWARFKVKYHLPVSQMYTSINDIPWDSLNRPGDGPSNYVPPRDYSAYKCR